MADIERLTSDKEDLLTKLQCYEEDLKRANECKLVSVYMFNAVVSLLVYIVLWMREKSISGMLAAIRRGNTGDEGQKSVSDMYHCAP